MLKDIVKKLRETDAVHKKLLDVSVLSDSDWLELDKAADQEIKRMQVNGTMSNGLLDPTIQKILEPYIDNSKGMRV